MTSSSHTALHTMRALGGNSLTTESSPMWPTSCTPAAAPNIATQITSMSATCSTYGGGLLNA
jgi:hypothetical protein